MKNIYRLLKDTINGQKIRTLSIEGTTNAQGALKIPSIPKENTIIGMSCSNNVNAKLSAWLYNGTDWYVQAIRWDTGQYIGNTRLAIVVRYIWGGGTQE